MKRPSLQFLNALICNRELIWRLTERLVSGRYRGSLLGWGWSLINPLLMLAVYTFVFSEVFKARWGSAAEASGTLAFAINLFAGLIVFNLFAECMNQSPTLILENPNYVTKVVFPLEALSVVAVGSSVFHALTSLVVLLLFQLLAGSGPMVTVLWLPLIWLPLLLGCLALSWLLACAGVFLRDVGQITGVLTSMLMFMSAVFYPVSALPLRWQPILQLNPLVQVIEQTRQVVVQGEAPSANYLIWGSLVTLVAAEVCYRGFCRSRRAFADVM